MKTPIENLNSFIGIEALMPPCDAAGGGLRAIPRASEGMLMLAARAPSEPDSGTEKGWYAEYKRQNPQPEKGSEERIPWVKARMAAWEHYKTFNWPVYWAKTIAGQLV